MNRYKDLLPIQKKIKYYKKCLVLLYIPSSTYNLKKCPYPSPSPSPSNHHQTHTHTARIHTHQHQLPNSISPPTSPHQRPLQARTHARTHARIPNGPPKAFTTTSTQQQQPHPPPQKSPPNPYPHSPPNISTAIPTPTSSGPDAFPSGERDSVLRLRLQTGCTPCPGSLSVWCEHMDARARRVMKTTATTTATRVHIQRCVDISSWVPQSGGSAETQRFSCASWDG